jgi:hypothetical protein
MDPLVSRPPASAANATTFTLNAALLAKADGHVFALIE